MNLIERLHDLVHTPAHTPDPAYPAPELRTARVEVARAQRELTRLDALVNEAEVALRARGLIHPASKPRS
jgi:hypothetical protein